MWIPNCSERNRKPFCYLPQEINGISTILTKKKSVVHHPRILPERIWYWKMNGCPSNFCKNMPVRDKLFAFLHQIFKMRNRNCMQWSLLYYKSIPVISFTEHFSVFITSNVNFIGYPYLSRRSHFVYSVYFIYRSANSRKLNQEDIHSERI